MQIIPARTPCNNRQVGKARMSAKRQLLRSPWSGVNSGGDGFTRGGGQNRHERAGHQHGGNVGDKIREIAVAVQRRIGLDDFDASPEHRHHHDPQHERHARIGHTVNDGQHEEREDVLHFVGRGGGESGGSGQRGHDQRE